MFVAVVQARAPLGCCQLGCWVGKFGAGEGSDTLAGHETCPASAQITLGAAQ